MLTLDEAREAMLADPTMENVSTYLKAVYTHYEQELPPEDISGGVK